MTIPEVLNVTSTSVIRRLVKTVNTVLNVVLCPKFLYETKNPPKKLISLTFVVVLRYYISRSTILYDY